MLFITPELSVDVIAVVTPPLVKLLVVVVVEPELLVVVTVRIVIPNGVTDLVTTV